MLQLQNIIIDRVKDTLQIKASKIYRQNTAGLRLSQNPQCNIRNTSHQWRHRESKRLLRQQYYIEYVKDKEISSSEVLNTVKAVINIYDPQICKDNRQVNRASQDNSDQNKELYSRDAQDISTMLQILLKKHFHPKISHIIQTINRSNYNVREHVYLMWLSEWSKVIFMHFLENKPRTSIDRKMKTLTSTFTLRQDSNGMDPPQKVLSHHQKIKMAASSDRKIKTELCQNRPLTSNCNKLIFFSKEHLYSFFKTELTSTYTFHSSCLDLDHQYLSRIPKLAKKINIKDYIDSMTVFLVRNGNGWIAEGICGYKDAWKERVSGLRERQMQREVSICSRQGFDCRQEGKTERRYADRRIKTASNQSDFQAETFLKPSKRRQLVTASETKRPSNDQSQTNTLVTKINAKFFNSCFSASRIHSAVQSGFKPSLAMKADNRAGYNPEQPKKKTYELNFIKRKEPNKRHQLLTKLNSTFMVSNRKDCPNSAANQSQKIAQCNDVDREEVTGCSESSKMDKSVFILDYSQGPNIARMNRQQLRLRGKRSVMLIAREAVLLGTARKEKLKIHEY